MTSIGDRLQQIRASLRLNQREMAEHLGMPPRTYQDHELGKNTQKFAFIQHLVDRGFSADWLLTGDGSMIRPPPPLRGLSEVPAVPFASKGVAFDQDLLKIVIEEIESVLNEADAELTPDKKAEVIALVYELALEEEGAGRPVDRGKVIRLIRLAG